MLEAFILGVIQGLTEFLPVSSSGHLIIAREAFGWNLEGSLAFDILLHLATMLAVLIYFRRDIIGLVTTFFALVRGKEVGLDEKRLLIAVTIGTIPAALAGLFLEDVISTAFRSATLVALALIGGSALMYAAEYVSKRKGTAEPLSAKKGFLVGCFQALALVPGMSRSGSTISGGLLLGIPRELAVRFSFILSFPIILGSAAKAMLGAGGGEFALSADVVLGFAAAFATGLLAIHFLVSYLKKHTFNIFIVYRVLLAAFVLILL